MKWYYTEGKLTVISDEKERNFILNDLVLEEVNRDLLIKRVKIVFFVIIIILCLLQFVVTSFPSNQTFYFYVGYFGTPIFIATILSSIVFVLLKNKRLELRALKKTFKSN